MSSDCLLATLLWPVSNVLFMPLYCNSSLTCVQCPLYAPLLQLFSDLCPMSSLCPFIATLLWPVSNVLFMPLYCNSSLTCVQCPLYALLQETCWGLHSRLGARLYLILFHWLQYYIPVSHFLSLLNKIMLICAHILRCSWSLKDRYFVCPPVCPWFRTLKVQN